MGCGHRIPKMKQAQNEGGWLPCSAPWRLEEISGRLFLFEGLQRFLPHRNGFEFFREVGQGLLDGEAFKTGGADETDAVGMLINIGGVFGGADRAAVGEENDVLTDLAGTVDDALGASDGIVHGADGTGYADGAADGGADVGDDGICAGFGHGLGFLGGGDIDDGEEVHLAGDGDHFELLLHAHAGFFEDAAEMTIHDGMGREVIDARKAHILDLQQPVPHAAAGVGGMDAANDRDFLDDGKDFVLTDFHGDGIGIVVGHQTGRGTVPRHAEASAIIYDDEVAPAAFDELGADAGPSASGDDRFTLFEGGAKAFNDFLTGVGVTFSSPGIWHMLYLTSSRLNEQHPATRDVEESSAEVHWDGSLLGPQATVLCGAGAKRRSYAFPRKQQILSCLKEGI
jgi:hypothetical protein